MSEKPEDGSLSPEEKRNIYREMRLRHEKAEAVKAPLRARFEASLEADRIKREAKYLRPVKPHASRYTTQSAVDWGKAQGWKILGREGYDSRTRRHHDLMLGTDVLFDTVTGGMVAIQGAGRYERNPHYRRFEEMGGAARAKRLGIKVLYLEFVRGNPEPVSREDWA